MNILICGESYTGKTTIGKAIAKAFDFKIIEVSALAGKGNRKKKASNDDQIAEGLFALDKDESKVIVGLRQVSLLSQIEGECLLVYIETDDQTRSDFFINREGADHTEKLVQAKLIDDKLGVRDFKNIANLQFVISSRNANETTWTLIAYIAFLEGITVQNSAKVASSNILGVN